MSVGPRFAPEELRQRLGLVYQFSPEQLDVISAPPFEPLLVVAGAGSGKTELMALRVAWLIVNAHVRPDQVLGLTFTRKAAGELAHRIRLYLGRAKQLLGHDVQLMGEPTVSTYHSFASRIVREHGMRAGYEPSVRLLTEAASWQIADAVVRQHDSPGMRAFPLGQASATAAVLALAGELSEHLRDVSDVRRFSTELAADIASAASDKVYRPVQDVLDRQEGRLALLPLVRDYAQRKADIEAMDFGDQLRRAAVVADAHAEVCAAERDRFRVVLLDEYQDTSEAQVVLLRALFGDGHPVTAVGDPCQSIYGWRGASAGTLERFPGRFRSPDGRDADLRWLTVSWRNAPQILAVANRVSEPLRAHGARVRPLRAPDTYTPKIAEPVVRCAFLETYLDEADWIGDQIVGAWREYEERFGSHPTTAVLVRARAQIPALELALRGRGLPVEVVGLGGLLDNPEVRDVVSTLQVLADPTAGAALLRLLTGARWRLGPRDVVALHRRARRIAYDRRPERVDVGDEPDLGGERLDDAVLAEGLDDPGPAAAYSTEGHRRLLLLRDELRALRERLDQSLPDLVADVAQTIGLDVEVAVRGGTATAAGLASTHLDAIGDVAARFAQEAEGGTLGAFLSYLAAAEEEERGLTPGEVEVVPGAVQILTVHAAKGLEWDVVSVSGLVEDSFPSKATAGDHWLKGIGVLPFPLRGDAEGLPTLDLSTATDGAAVRDAVARFDEDWRAHQEREERRLAYVAVTRPRHRLLCSGFQWGRGLSKPRLASTFLEEIAEVCRDGNGSVQAWAEPPVDDATNPTLAEEVSAVWPLDPLGERRAAVLEGAAMVRVAMTGPGVVDPDRTGGGDGGVEAEWAEQAARWEADVELLLAERARQQTPTVVDVALPEQLSVSQLVSLKKDPQQLARRLRRPLPEAPDPQARRGTAFHLWLEQRLVGGAGGFAPLLDLDDLPGAGDLAAAPDEDVEELQRAFLASDWADRHPVAVEVPFATVVAGVVVRGRMDAVFANLDRPGHFDVIDWKTGKRPTGTDAAAAAVQLAAYRLAWADLTGVPVDNVTAGFHYVRDAVTVRPADLLDADALTALVTNIAPSTP